MRGKFSLANNKVALHGTQDLLKAYGEEGSLYSRYLIYNCEVDTDNYKEP